MYDSLFKTAGAMALVAFAVWLGVAAARVLFGILLVVASWIPLIAGWACVALAVAAVGFAAYRYRRRIGRFLVSFAAIPLGLVVLWTVAIVGFTAAAVVERVAGAVGKARSRYLEWYRREYYKAHGCMPWDPAEGAAR